MLRFLIHRLLRYGKKSISKSKKSSAPSGTNSRTQLRLERLETRELPAVFLVTNAADTGPGTLRQAILDANTTGDVDDINIDPSVGTIELLSPLPNIDTSMTINGPTGAPPTIGPASGIDPFRIFTIPFNGNMVSLTSLTLTGGSAGEGGAIWSFADLTIAACGFTFNTATSRGGAIFQMLAPLTVTGSFFANNTAGSAGGAISFESGGVQPLTIATTGFVLNAAGLHGGAVFYQANGHVTFNSCVFTANTALAGNGGAISCPQCASLTVVGPFSPSTSPDVNAAAGNGGLIFARVELNVTIDFRVFGNTSGDGLSDGFFITLSPSATADINFAKVFDTFVLIRE